MDPLDALKQAYKSGRVALNLFADESNGIIEEVTSG